MKIGKDQKGSSDDSEEENKARKKGYSSSDSEEEEYLDVVNDPYNPVKHSDKVQAAQKARQSVCAEIFGKYHLKASFNAQVIQKSEIIQQKIKELTESKER